jgi:alpha-galactosidase
MGKYFLLASFLLLGTIQAEETNTIRLDTLDLKQVAQGWGLPQKNLSVDKHPLSIGGKKFDHGFGTHADSKVTLDMDGAAGTFSAMVGVDDEVGAKGTVRFTVIGDKQKLWDSGVMKGGDAAKEVNVSLAGIKRLSLVVDDAGDGSDSDHADWADAVFTLSGAAPVIHKPSTQPYILTPPAPDSPRINGAKVFGVRPGNPFLYTIAATGARPMEFAADNLPAGLTLDSKTGRITGKLDKPGEYLVMLHARNKDGALDREATRGLKIVCGGAIALTPPMGWNSWNCWAGSVSDDKVRAAADAMVNSGLINHGWTYINIDDYWEYKPAAKDDPTLQGPARDDNGFINPNKRFPDMKALTDYVHSKGLKIGLYSSPGPLTCGGCIASYQHEDQDAQRWAEWGFDYVKYDWCSYGKIASKPPTLDEMKKPYQVMRASLDKQPRDILFSFCQYGMGNVWEWGAETGGNCWRTTGDITDTWGSLSNIGFHQNGHEIYAGPGHWNDPDMLIVGYVGWSANLHPTRLTPDEQYTHISLWCLLSSPLLIGCDMTRFDDFTLNLLTNDEVLAVNQDPLGKPAGQISNKNYAQVWARDLEDGSKAVGLFNLDDDPQEVTAKWSDLKIDGKRIVHDLWRQKDVGEFSDEYKATVPPHGVVLVKIAPGA